MTTPGSEGKSLIRTDEIPAVHRHCGGGTNAAAGERAVAQGEKRPPSPDDARSATAEPPAPAALPENQRLWCRVCGRPKRRVPTGKWSGYYVCDNPHYLPVISNALPAPARPSPEALAREEACKARALAWAAAYHRRMMGGYQTSGDEFTDRQLALEKEFEENPPLGNERP